MKVSGLGNLGNLVPVSIIHECPLRNFQCGIPQPNSQPDRPLPGKYVATECRIFLLVATYLPATKRSDFAATCAPQSLCALLECTISALLLCILHFLWHALFLQCCYASSIAVHIAVNAPFLHCCYASCVVIGTFQTHSNSSC